MPNLFRWTDTRGSGKDRSEDSDEDDSAESEKESKYVSKPSLFDRLFRRSAN